MPRIRCHSCGTQVDIAEPIPRDAECASCGMDLRCCLNCRHHDPSFNNQCRETEADPVADKDRRNFCEFFSGRAPSSASGGGAARGAPATGSGFARPGPVDRAAEARRALDRLFSKPKPDPEDDE
jgi:hypothetical protein